MMRVLILGGYGTFGGRLARLLAPDPRVEIVIAGRSAQKAQIFVATLGAAGGAQAARIDRDDDLAAHFERIRPDVVVDATGPFQSYGLDPYRVVRASLASGANYLDLADGAAFVAGIGAFEAEAAAASLFVLSGVSSFPVLTAAVLRALSAGLISVESVTGGIAPSPYAGVGPNVIRAIMGYAGKPIDIVRNGRMARANALTETVRYTIAPPGHLPLRSTLFGLVEVPDLTLIPLANPAVRHLWMGAGPVPEVLFRALVGLAKLVRLGVLPGLGLMAPIAYRAINLLRWGEHRGGMFVEVAGAAPTGRPVRRSWHMLAEGDDGPFIPSMAVQAIVLKCLDGQAPLPGARTALAALELEDYDRVFAGRRIVAGFRDDGDESAPLYRGLLGSAWERLPQPVRALHDLADALVATGRADVEVGRNPLARLAGRMIGFPRAGRDVPVTVRFSVKDGRETWTRTFGDQTFHSTQEAGRGRNERLLLERFGPLAIGIALVVDGGRLRLVVRRASAFGIPVPRVLLPRGDTYESDADGRFTFHVEVKLPVVGLVAKYIGWLEPTARAGSAGH